MLVLALDTSTPTVTAGVAQVTPRHEALVAGSGAQPAGPFQQATGPFQQPADGHIPLESSARMLAEKSITDPFAHAEQLMPLALAALDAAGHRLAEIGSVVVGLGPGPFTGLRVGVATAAALGDGLAVPVHGIPTHDGMAAALVAGAGTTDDFLVVTDARRREVYLSAYRADGRRSFGPAVLAPAAVADTLVARQLSPSAVVGPGAVLLADHVELPVRPFTGSLAAGLVLRAMRPLLTGAVPGPLTPLYLRRPDATEPAAQKPVSR